MKRDMTFEEKLALSQDINKLPRDKLGVIVQIIHNRHPNLKKSGENDETEIEIDIDSLDTRTLREMEKFVKGQLKKLHVANNIQDVQGKLKKLQEKTREAKGIIFF